MLKFYRNKVLTFIRTKIQQSNYKQLVQNHALPDNDANELIYQKLVSNEPSFISRFGSSELASVLFFREHRLKKQKEAKWNSFHKEYLCDISGFFPFEEEPLDAFSKLYLQLIPNIDILGVWNIGEERIADMFDRRIKLVNLPAIEPYYFDTPWSRGLAGKKVLVIHPFADSIAYQYSKRHLLFSNPNILPEFDLQIIKAVQTVADNTQGYKDWFSALEYMYVEIAKLEFDVAIIGAGAYGMPLANYVKTEMGKIAIHMGGASQILFGIKGKRWENHSKVNKLYNEHWILPSQTERPSGLERVEGGSYW